MKPRRGKRTDRAGYALVLFVMMVFGLMGLAALVIDMGFARLAQRQMQTAVDSAALEGLRWRDVTEPGDLPQGWLSDPDFQAQTGVSGTVTMSPQQCERVRRWAASHTVANMFADYVDPNSGETVHYGAGPIVNFSGGISSPELAASQLMQPGSPPVYQPKRSDGTPGLELNQNSDNPNAVEGDVVAGTYGLNSSYQPDSGDPQGSRDENNAYGRRDFQNTSNQAFLVRMRRTANPNGIDSEAGISSGGVIVNSDGTSSPATLPFLFGRGGMMARSGDPGQLSVTSGITVRAAAIAAAGPATGLGQTSYEVGRAKAAGPPYQGTDANNNPVNIPGTTPFSITVGAWNSMPANVPQAFQSSSGSGDVQWFGNSPNERHSDWPVNICNGRDFYDTRYWRRRRHPDPKWLCADLCDGVPWRPAVHDHWLRIRAVELGCSERNPDPDKRIGRNLSRGMRQRLWRSRTRLASII